MNSSPLHLETTKTDAFDFCDQPLILHIFSFLSPVDLTMISMTKKFFRNLAADNVLWKRHCFNEFRGKAFDKMMKESTPQWQRFYSQKTAINKRMFAGHYNSSIWEYHANAINCMHVFDEVIYSVSKADKFLHIAYPEAKTFIRCCEHSAEITVLEIVEKTLFTGTYDGHVSRWNLETDRCEKQLKLHFGPVLSLTFEEDLLISGGNDGNMSIWNQKKTDKEIHQFKNVPFYELCFDSCSVRCLKLVNKQLFAGGDGNRIRQWDLNNEVKLIKEFKGCRYTVSCLAVTDTMLVSGSGDHTIRMWDLVTGVMLKCLDYHKSWINCLDVNDGWIISGDRSGSIWLYNLANKQSMSYINAHKDEITVIEFFKGCIVSSACDKIVQIRDYNFKLKILEETEEEINDEEVFSRPSKRHEIYIENDKKD